MQWMNEDASLFSYTLVRARCLNYPLESWQKPNYPKHSQQTTNNEQGTQHFDPSSSNSSRIIRRKQMQNTVVNNTQRYVHCHLNETPRMKWYITGFFPIQYQGNQQRQSDRNGIYKESLCSSSRKEKKKERRKKEEKGRWIKQKKFYLLIVLNCTSMLPCLVKVFWYYQQAVG